MLEEVLRWPLVPFCGSGPWLSTVSIFAVEYFLGGPCALLSSVNVGDVGLVVDDWVGGAYSGLFRIGCVSAEEEGRGL